MKPMMVVTTSGYIVSVLGPYLSDSKNNDAGILNHMIKKNAEEMRSWLNDGDTFIVDRGFRDSADVLSDIVLGWRCHVSLEVQSNTQPRNRTVPG